MKENTRLLFERARASSRHARSLERQAATLARKAEREYAFGEELFVRACRQLSAEEPPPRRAGAKKARRDPGKADIAEALAEQVATGRTRLRKNHSKGSGRRLD